MTKPKELKVGDRVRVVDHSHGIPESVSVLQVIGIGDWGFGGADNITLEHGWLAKRYRLRKLPDRKEGA